MREDLNTSRWYGCCQMCRADILHHSSIKFPPMKGLTCPSKRQKAHETSWFFSFWDDCSCCVSVSVTVVRCSSLFFWSRVSSGPWCQSAHQSAGLLLRRPAAQRSYTWAGPRCGSTEVRHTHTHTHTHVSITQSVTMTTSRAKSIQWQTETNGRWPMWVYVNAQGG